MLTPLFYVNNVNVSVYISHLSGAFQTLKDGKRPGSHTRGNKSYRDIACLLDPQYGAYFLAILVLYIQVFNPFLPVN